MENQEKISKHVKISEDQFQVIEQQQNSEKDDDYCIENSNSDLDEEAILEAIEKDEESKGNEFDDKDLIELIKNFDSNVQINLELREIHKDSPEKLGNLTSQVSIHNISQHFIIQMFIPQLLLCLQALPNLIQLIGHPNIDISTDVISLFSDLIDMEITEALYDIVIEFYYKLVENDFFEGLVSNFQRFNEKIRDDFNIIHKSLQIVENLLEVIPKFAEEIVNRTQILQWLAKRIHNSDIDDDNCLYASEILAILLQQNTENQFTFGSIGGLDDILIVLSNYRKIDPKSEEEKELIENLFDCLCFSLQVSENRERFRILQGIDLMIRILRANNYCSTLTIKVLDYTFQRSPENCLKFLFPFFLKKKQSEKEKQEIIKYDEHIISSNSVDLERVLNKFRENSNEKIERLFEIQQQYEKMVMQSQLEYEKNIEIQNEFELNSVNTIQIHQQFYLQNSKEDLYFHKLSNGLSILQYNSYIILFLMNLNYPDIKLKLKTLFKKYNYSLKNFQKIIQNQLKYLKQDDFIAKDIEKVLQESKGTLSKEIPYPIIQEEKIESYAQFEAN